MANPAVNQAYSDVLAHLHSIPIITFSGGRAKLGPIPFPIAAVWLPARRLRNNREGYRCLPRLYGMGLTRGTGSTAIDRPTAFPPLPGIPLRRSPPDTSLYYPTRFDDNRPSLSGGTRLDGHN